MQEELQELEKNLDETVLQHRLMMEENHCKRLKCKKRLRLFIEANVIHGRVINDYSNPINLKTTDLIKRILYLEDNFIVAEYLAGPEELDTFFFDSPNSSSKREVIIELKDNYIYNYKEPFKTLFNKKTDTHTNLLIDLWKYAHQNKLCKDGKVVCDNLLVEVFHKKEFFLENICPKKYLEPVDLIRFELKEAIYDVEIELDDLVNLPILYQHPRITHLTKKIEEITELIGSLENKIEVLSGLIEKKEDYIDLNCVDDKMNFFYNQNVQELVVKLAKSLK